MKGTYAAMLCAPPVRRSLGTTLVDGTLVVVPAFWALVDLVAAAVVRGLGRTPSAVLG